MGALTLSQWLAMKELNNEELAEKSGISATTISNIRQKKVKPRYETWHKLAEALEINMFDIRIE